MIKPRFKKILIFALSLSLGLLVLLVVVLSPLAKYLLEKHGKDLFGRELKMDWAYVNPFTGYAHLGNPRLYEAIGDSTFLNVKGVHGKITMRKLLSQEVEINELTFESPIGRIIQKNKPLNIDDVIKKFTPDKSRNTKDHSSGWHVDVTSLTIVNGEFHYVDKLIPIKYFIKKVNLQSLGKLSAGDTLSSDFSFFAGIGSGDMKGHFTINTRTNDYHFDVKVRDYDLELIRQYIWELINYGMFTAHLDADLKATGNFNSKESISSKGRLALRDFHLGKTTRDDYASFKELVFVVEEMSPSKGKFLFDSVALIQPFIKYERYDSLDNIETLFGQRGSNITDITRQPGRFNLVIEIARYVKVMTQKFFKSDYKVNKLKIEEGSFRFNDYSVSEKFSMDIRPLSILGDSINKSDRRVELFLKSGIKPYGDGSIQLSINPKDSGDFDMHYHFEKIPVAAFNPYVLSYTSFPIDRGTIEVNGAWKVRDGNIQSSNHLIVIDPRLSKRVKNRDLKWLPMPLIMAIIREEGNVVDYEIPITGNLKNPRFHLRGVLLDVVKNILIKPPTTFYRLEVRDLEKEIEQSLTVKWEMRSRMLRPAQVNFVRAISDFLKVNGGVSISVFPITYAEKEKEHILFFETKKKYFLMNHGLNEKSWSSKDSTEVEKMSIKDPVLVRRLKKNLPDTVMFTLQEKCLNYVGAQIVNKKFNQLIKDRDSLFISYFRQNGTDTRVKIHSSVNELPYNGFSYFKLNYDKEIPGPVLEAYRKMIELNDEEPRKKYLQFRKKKGPGLVLNDPE